MTQEEKDLLLKDLCARLPYGVKYNYDGYIGCDYTMNQVDCNTVDCTFLIESVKPYLFPLSSMTEEQRKEFLSVADYERREEDCGRHTETYYYDMVGHEYEFYPNSDVIDYCNKNHLDYRGLIEKGLAIDATGKNIY